MGRVFVRSIWAHRRRLVGTVSAIVLGVAFLAATLILATALRDVTSDLVQDPAASIDALVQGRVLSVSGVGGTDRAALPASTVARVRALDGVAAAEGRVSVEGSGSTNRVLAPLGWALGGKLGPSTVIESWIPDPSLTPYRLVTGRAPDADDEVVLDVHAAEQAGVRVGDRLSILSQLGRQPFRLVGTFRSGSAPDVGGTVSAEVTLAVAQRIAGIGTDVQQIFVGSRHGVASSRLVQELRRAVPGADVRTGDDARMQLAHGSTPDIRFLQAVLQIFGALALVVGGFVIANTFVMLVAQRTRELALLRTLGASRLQVFASVLAEALLLGAASSIVGLLLGTRLASWINRALAGIRAQVPTSALTVRPSTVALSIGLGMAVTLAAALVPALRATRIAPLAVLRDAEADRSGRARPRVVGGGLSLALGALLCAEAWWQRGASRGLPLVGIGALLVFAGIVVAGPAITAPVLALPTASLRRSVGTAPHLAVEHAAHDPRRTAAAASTVLVTVALVIFIAAFAASATHSVDADASRGFVGDFIVTGPGGLTLPNGLFSAPIPRTIRDDVARVPGVELVAGMGFSAARVTYPDGGVATHFTSSIDAAGLGPVLRPRMVEGSASRLDDHGILVDRILARDHHLHIGDTLGYAVGSSRSVSLRIEGISDDPNLLGDLTVTRRTYSRVAPAPTDVQIGGVIAPGADPLDVLQHIQAVVGATPGVQAFDRAGFVNDLDAQIHGFIGVIYGLLVLSVLIALLGVANTMSLTIHERTRELGLLRALGMDRAAVRAAVRWETGLVASYGTLVGAVVGVALSTIAIRSLRGLGLVTFSLPMDQLAVIVVGAVVLGTLSSIRPARRAAAVSILDAIAAE